MVDIHSLNNPYWDAVKANPGDDISLKYDKKWVPAGHPPLNMVRGRGPEARKEYEDWLETYGRSALVKRYSWAIPSPESIEWMLKVLDGRPVVEIGCGTGYWAWLLEQAGVDVNAYDHKPPALGYNHWHCSTEARVKGYTQEERDEHFAEWKKFDELAASINDAPGAMKIPRTEYVPLPEEGERQVLAGHAGQQYVEVVEGDHTALKLPENENRVLFLSWPPYDRPMAEEVLDAFAGDTLIHIGEPAGGCTGTEAFFERLEEEWIEAAGGPLVQWSGMHDYLTVFVRKTAKRTLRDTLKRMHDAEV